MAKTILAGKQVKKFAGKYGLAIFTFIYTVFPGLPKYLFVRYCPGNAGNGDGQYKQVNCLRQ
jgi:hypothetical protein